MSQPNSDLHSIKGKSVYMILYNYGDCDYSVIKIMENLNDAYNYICVQETDLNMECKMIDVKNPLDLKNKMLENYLNICYISSGKYNKFNLCDEKDNMISNYIIIPMTIN
jgi:hypothetical protein